MNAADLRKEVRIRKLAKRRGYVVRKSRRRFSSDNFGEFKLIDNHHRLVLGGIYDASLEEIEAFLQDEPIDHPMR